MDPEFLRILRTLKVGEGRLGCALIVAGEVYLIAFNTVLTEVNLWYFGFIVLVAIVCVPFVLTAPVVAETVVLYTPHVITAPAKKTQDGTHDWQ
jgi:hypothetical protein